MTTAELLERFESDPSDHKAFGKLLDGYVEAQDADGLVAVLERVPEWAAEGSQSPLVRVLGQKARTCKDVDYATLMHFHSGMLHWQTFGDAQKAEMAFRKMKAQAPDPEPLREFYLEFYTAQDNWRRLEQFLTDPLKGAMEDVGEVRRMLGRLAQERGKADKAMGFWQAVAKATPGDDEAEQALRGLYTEVGKWHAMVDLLKGRLDRGGDDLPVEERIDTHLEMIAIFKEHLNAPSKVVSAWQAILALDPKNLDALDALAAEYEAMKRWPNLVRVLEQKAEHVDEPGQIALHRRIAGIYEGTFNNPNAAVEHWRRILALDPLDDEAVERLKTIAMERRDWETFVQLSEDEVERIEDADERAAARLELAKLASERIRKPPTPIRLWETVLGADADHPDALEMLEGLYEREKRWEDLADVLERRAAKTDDGEIKRALLDKLGPVVQSRLGDDARAATVYRQLLELDPKHHKALAELKKRYIVARDWEHLEWFFRTYGTVQEWVRTLESQAKGIAKGDPEKVQLLFTAAVAWMDELDDSRRAVKSLEKVLELQPEHAEAAERLLPVYERLEQWKRLPSAYSTVLAATEEPGRRRELHLALATVHDAHLGAPSKAFDAVHQALSEAADDVGLHPELRRLAGAAERWEDYVLLLGDQVEGLTDDLDRVSVLSDLARVYRDRLEDPEEARDLFEKVLELDCRHTEALHALEALHEGAERFDELAAVLERRLELAVEASDTDARLALGFRLAEVHGGSRGAAAQAEEVLRDLLGAFPTDTRVHDRLAALLLAAGRHAELMDLLALERVVLGEQGAPTEQLAALECQLGMLAYATQVEEDPEAAVRDAIDRYEAALGCEPAHADTVARLEELLADEEARGRVCDLLEPVYAAADDHVRLADVLELQLALATDGGDEARQGQLLAALAERYDGPLADAELAWRTYGRRVRLDAGRADVRARFEALTDQLGKQAQLVAVYAEVADAPASSEARIGIKLVAARTLQGALEDLDGARDYYHRVVDEEPNHGEALSALEAIYLDLDRAEDLLGIYRRRIDLAEDVPTKLDYLFRTLDVQRDRLEALDDAVGTAREALDLAPGHDPAVTRLDELLTRTEAWDDLAQVLDDTLALIEAGTVEGGADRAVVVRRRLAGLCQGPLEDVERAIGLWASVFELSPDDAATVAALEGLFAHGEGDAAAAVAPLLQPTYERAERWEDLVRVMTTREAAADDPASKIDWQFQIAAVHEEKLGALEPAFEALGVAMELDPSSERTLGELLRVSEALDNPDELVLHLAALVDDILDDGQRRNVHRTLVGLTRDKTGDLASAETHLRAMLDLDADDVGTVDQLIALYRGAAGDSASGLGEPPSVLGKLIEMLLYKAPRVAELSGRVELLRDAGQLAASDLGDDARAIEIYETLRQEDPEDAGALDALEVLHERTENWEQLVGVFREKIARAESLDIKKLVATMMGTVQADKLESPDDAIDTWRTVHGWDPEDLAPLEELDRLYTAQEDWFSLLDVLRTQQELVGDDAWLTLQARVARLHERDEQLADPRMAIQTWGELLDRSPETEEAVVALEAIVADRDERDEAFKVLRPVLAKRGDHERLWRQWHVMVSHQADDPPRLSDSYHAMAKLAEGPLGDPHRAFGALSKAFTQDPRSEQTVGELERLAEAHTLWEELQTLYGEVAEDVDDMRALELRLEVGAIRMDRLEDTDRAIETFEALHGDEPEHPVVLDRLHRLFEATGDAEKLAATLREQVEAAGASGERVRHLTKLARVAEEQLEDTDRAYEAYLEILDLDGDSELAVSELWRLYVDGVHRLGIAERLEPIYTSKGQWTELHALYELKLDALEDAVDSQLILRQLAELNLHKMGRKSDAVVWFGRAFRYDPEDEGLLQEMIGLVEETGLHQELHTVLMDAAGVAEEPERKVELWHRAAGLSRSELADAESAEAIYRTILETAEEDLKALAGLDELLTAAERWDDLEPVLAKEADAADFDDERIRHLERLGALYRDELGRADDAIGAFARIVEAQDTHRGALTALQALYRDAQQWQPLFDVLQQTADTAGADSERVACYVEMAGLAERRLERAEDAVSFWEEVLAVAPERVDAVHELERLHEQLGNLQSLAEAFERELAMGQADADRQLELYKRLGALWQGELDDALAAQGYWERAREFAPHDREALEALRELLREAGSLEGLAGVLEASLEAGHWAEDSDATLRLWRELAELRTTELGQALAGIEAWVEVLSLAAGDADAMENLDALYTQEGEWDALVELCRLALDGLGEGDEATGHRVEGLLRIAELHRDQRDDAVQAAQAFEELLSVAPSHLDASLQLEALYERASDHVALAGLLERRVPHLEDAWEKLSIHQRIARIKEAHLADAGGAFDALVQANGVQHDDPQTLQELMRLAGVTGRWDELVGVHDASFVHLEDDARLELLVATAVVVRDRLEDPLRAIAYYERALEEHEEHEATLRALVELHSGLERWDAMVSVLKTLADVTMDHGERLELLKLVAEVQELQLEDVDAAVTTWREVLEVDEMGSGALDALERIFTGESRWEDLTEVLDTRARVFPAEASALGLRIGDVLREKLDRVEDAIERYEDVLTYAPSDADALGRLEAIYGEQEAWERLADVYERSFDGAADEDDRIRFAQNIALLRKEVFEDLEGAADWQHRILQLAPGHPEAIEALEGIYTEGEQWDDLVQTYETKAQAFATVGEATGQAAALTQMAETFRGHLDDVDRAIETYLRVLDVVAGDRAALTALKSLYEGQELWDSVLDVLDRTLAVEADPGTRLALMTEQGALVSERLSDPFRAAQYYERALVERPGHAPAIEAMLSLYLGEERYDLVVEVLHKKLEAAADAGARAAIEVDLAGVWRDELRDTDQALKHLESAYEADPDNRAALAQLADHYVGEQAWTKAMPLLDLLIEALEGAGDPEGLAKAMKRIGQCSEALFDQDRALDAYKRSADLAPPDLDTLNGLARIHTKREEYAEAEHYLRTIVDERREEVDDETFVDVCMRLGESAWQLGDSQRARKYLARVIEHQPDNVPAIEHIIEVLEAHGDWGDAIRYKERLLPLAHEPIRKFATLMSIGDIYRERLTDPTSAVDAYKRALEHGTFSKAPIIQLVGISSEAGDWPTAIAFLEKLVEAEDAPEKKARYAMHIAVVYRDELKQPDDAVTWLNRVLDHNIGQLEAFQSIDALLTRLKEWKKLEQNYRKMIQRVQTAGASFEKGPSLLFQLYRNLGEIYRSRLTNDEYATSAFELASRQRPGDLKVREILAELYEKDDKRLAHAIEQHNFLLKRRIDRFESYHRLVSLYERGGQHDQAWCVAALLMKLGKADKVQEQFYQAHTVPTLAKARVQLTDEHWVRLLMPQGMDPAIGHAFSLVYDALIRQRPTQTPKDFGLHPKKNRQSLEEVRPVVSTLKTVSAAIGVPIPDTFKDEGRTGPEILLTTPPSLALGQDLYAGKTEKELAYQLTKILTYFHPWFRIATVYDRLQLEILFVAMAKTVNPDFQIPSRTDVPPETQAAFNQRIAEAKQSLDKNVTGERRQALKQVMEQYWSRNKAPQIGQWHRQLELTAIHAALWVTGDPAEVWRFLKNEAAGRSKLERGDKLKDLVLYGTSERFFELRRVTGTRIDHLGLGQ